MEPAAADGPGRRGCVTAGRARPGQPASLPDAPVAARARSALGWPLAGSTVKPDAESVAGQAAQGVLTGPQVARRRDPRLARGRGPVAGDLYRVQGPRAFEGALRAGQGGE